MATAYSTEAQIRANSKKITVTALSSPGVVDRIDMADNKIRQDLANYVDFDLITIGEGDTGFPDWLNLLSQYKSTELSLVSIYGAKRHVQEVSDIQYWQDCYNKLLDNVKEGSIPLELGDGTSVGTGNNEYQDRAKSDIPPALGTGRHGDYLSDDEIRANGRPLDNNGTNRRNRY